MKIEARHSFIYFSENPGSKSFVPLTDWEVEAFPTLLMLKNAKDNRLFHLHFNFNGPVSQFKMFLNLEKDLILVQGFDPHQQFFRYQIQKKEQSIEIVFKKGINLDQIHFDINCPLEVQTEKKTIKIKIPDLRSMEAVSREILLLGMHKKQDIDLMLRRNDPKEILPLWFQLAQLLPTCVDHSQGLCHLIDRMNHHIHLKEKPLFARDLQYFIPASFTSFLMPRLNDENHTGIEKKEKFEVVHADKIALITKGKKILRSLFLDQKNDAIEILPCLPISFSSGHCMDWVIEDRGLLSFAWSNHHLKKISFAANKDFDLLLHLPHGIKEFRMRKERSDKGIKIHAQEKISVKAGEEYFFDRFTK
jgi:hypothetical protein